ncbi:MAG: mechanosensitive ion channel family protein [Gammaproteobacteria bacterium]
MINTDDLLALLVEQFSLWSPRIGGAVMVLLVFYIISKLLLRLMDKNIARFKLDIHLMMLIRRALRITLMIIALITAFGTLGIDISALVAGLGLTGFALGFALKDTISNLLSGVLILLYRPFEIGSHIEVSGHQGKVTSIDLRYTELENDGHRVLIPNSKLFTDPIKVSEESAEADRV